MSEQAATTITLQDIALMVSVIDASVKRGGIEGSELTLVGGLRDKLDRFIKENAPATEEKSDS